MTAAQTTYLPLATEPEGESLATVCRATSIVLVSTVPVFRILPETLTDAWVIGVIGFVLLCAALSILRQPVGAPVWLVSAALATLGAGTASWNALQPDGHLLIAVQIVVWFALAPWVAAGLLTKVRGLGRQWCVTLVAAQSVSALAGLAQGFLGITVIGYGTELGRAVGLAGHSNILGLMSGVAIILALTEILDHGRWRAIAGGIALVNLGGLLVCGSISALFASALAVVVLLVARRTRPATPILVASAAAVGLWLVTEWTDSQSASVKSPLERLLQVTGQTQYVGTLEQRGLTISYAWERIKADPWFGAGLDDWSGATFDGETVTHNVLFRTWFQGGFGLGLAFLLLYVLVAVLVWRSLHHQQHATAAAVLVTVAGFALTSAALNQGYFWLPILGAIGFYSVRTPATTSPS